MFFRNDYAETHTMAAFMVGSHEGPTGSPFADDMTIRDCRGRATAKAFHGKLIFREAKDSRYYQERHNTENVLVVRDLGTPPTDLVRITNKEPCRPFPPFCAGMGDYNWAIHGSEWMGEILNYGKETTMAGLTKVFGPETSLKITSGSGQADDMRFLFLYSSYQFSNTRWSPLMNIIWTILFLAPLVCCCWCCIRCCQPSPPGEAASVGYKGEQETLMQTIESEREGLKKTQANSGFFACCSRRGGREVAVGEVA